MKLTQSTNLKTEETKDSGRKNELPLLSTGDEINRKGKNLMLGGE